MLLARSMTDEELARQLMVCLSTELGINGDHLIATMRDRAAVRFKHYRLSTHIFSILGVFLTH